jgi:hypothetical protein
MKIVIDIPLNQEELEKEIENQTEEFRKLGFFHIQMIRR